MPGLPSIGKNQTRKQLYSDEVGKDNIVPTNLEPKKTAAVPGVASASKQPPLQDIMMGLTQTAPVLGITEAELTFLAEHYLVPHKRFAKGVYSFSLTAIKDFMAKSYWPSGKPHADGARKRVADPSAAWKVQHYAKLPPEQTTKKTGVPVDVLEGIRKSTGRPAHLDYGGGVIRYLGPDLDYFLVQANREVHVRRRQPKIEVPPVPVPAPTPTPREPPPAPLQQRPPAVAVRKIQPNSAMAKSPAVTSVATPAAAAVREALPVEITPKVPVQGSSTVPVVPVMPKYEPRMIVDLAACDVLDACAFSSALGTLQTMLGRDDIVS